MTEKFGPVKNVLTVIAIFAGLAETSGTAVLPFLLPQNQNIFIWFVMSFPFVLLLLFFTTLNWNHKVLYGPGEYADEKNFLKTLEDSTSTSDFLKTLNQIYQPTDVSKDTVQPSPRDDAPTIS